ncbi:MAG: PAS domain S-box protein, partial [Chloroflexi bacterium]|nr:PAS domain S-box protein [Chloroflexota bacterium]
MKKRTLFKSLEAKITWQMMLISLLPIIIIGSFAYYTADQSVQATKKSLQDSRSTLEKNVVSTNIVSTAQRAIADIDQRMLDLIEQSVALTSYPGILQAAVYYRLQSETLGLHEMSKEQAEITVAENAYLYSHSILDDYLNKQLAFEEHTKQILVTDSHGLRAVSTGISSDFVLSDELWWKTAWQEGFYTGISKYVDSSEFWGVDIAVRIKDPKTGEFVGVFKTVLDIAAIQELAENNTNFIEAGNISVFTSDELLLAETSSLHQAERIMTPDIELSASTETAVNLAIHSDGASGYNLANETVAGFARSAQAGYYESINGFDGFGWGVVVEQPQEIAFASLNSFGALKDDLNNSRRELSIAIIGIAVAMTLVVLFIAIRQSRKITGPISRLRYAAERIRMGDDEVEIAIEADDEIGDLAVAFGRMFLERRQAMEVLKDNEERFRTIFEHSNDHIIYIDKSGIIVDTNSKVEELYGYTPEEVIGKNFTDIDNIVSQYLPKITTYFDGMIEGNKPDGLTEVEIIHKDGRVIIAEANVSAVRIDGEVEGMLAIVRNVTDRKRTEEALQENEMKFRTIFEHANDQIIYLDEAGIIIDVNNRIKDIWGYEREEVIGKHFMDFSFVLPESMNVIAEKFTQALTENQT